MVELLLVFLIQIAIFSLPPFYAAMLPKHRQSLVIYVYLGIVLFIGGFMGSIYSFQLNESITISGGNLTYGAFMMTAVLLVIMERDISAFRNVVVLVIATNVLKLLAFSGFSWALNTDGILNPFDFSPDIFSFSIGFMILGGFLIVTELLLLILLFERIKTRVTRTFTQLLLYVICYIVVLCLDGIAFPLIAFMFDPKLVHIVVGGISGKIVMASAYGVSMFLFFLIFRKQLLYFAEQPLVLRDILHYSRTELIQATLQSQERYQQFVETAHDLIWAIDTEGRITFMNQAANRVYGRSPDEMIGHLYTDFVPSEQVEINAKSWETALQNNDRIQNFENWVLHKDGKHVLLNANAVLLRNAQGEVEGSMGTSQDITERKAAEQQMKFQVHLLNAVQEAVIATDLNGKVIYWNNYASQLYGWTEDEALGQDISVLTVPESNLAQSITIMDTLRKGEKWSGEFIVKRKDGRPFPASVTNSPIFNENGELTGIIGLSDDISERKRAEAELRKLHAAVEQSASSVVITNLQGDIEYVNRKFTETTGYTANQVLGKNPRILKSGETSSEDYKQLWTTISTGGVWHGEFHNRKKNGDLFWEMASISPIKDEAGRITNFLAIKEDITERKKMEEALAQERRLLRTVINSLPDRIYAKDVEGRFTIKNAYGQQMDASSTDERIGKTDFDYFPLELAEQYHVDDQAVIRSGQALINKEESSVDPEGNPRWILTTKVPLHNNEGKVIGLVGIGRDITERKQAEKSLQESEIRYRQLIENLHSAVVVHAPDTAITLYNKRATDLLGISDDELFGKTANDPVWRFTRPDGSTMPIEEYPVNRILDSQKPLINLEIGINRPHTADIIWVLVNAFPTVDKQGVIQHVVVTFTDITERRQMDDSIRQSEAALNQAQQVAHVGSWAWHIQDNHLEWSDEMYRIFGIEKKTFSGDLSEVINRAIHPDDRAAVEKANASVIDDSTPIPIEYRVVLSDGTERNIWAEAGELRLDSAGNPNVLTGIVQDITERNKTEIQLRKLNRTLTLLSDVNQSIVRLRSISELFEEVCRIAFENGNFRMTWVGLLDSETKKVNPVAYAGIVEDYIENLGIALNDTPHGQGPIATAMRTGTRVIINDIENDSSMSPWRDDALRLGYRAVALFPLLVAGEVRGVFGLYADTREFFDDAELKLLDELASDISFAMEFDENEKQRLQAETELKDHMQIIERMRLFLQTTLDAFPANAAVLSPDGTIINVNAPWINFAVENDAPAPMHYIGQNYLTVCDMAEGEGSDESALTLAGIRAVIDGSLDEFYLEYPCHSPIERRWFALRVTPFPEPTPCRVVVAHINVTERREAEEKLKTMNHQLEERVIERTARLQMAKERVEAILNNSIDTILLINEDLRIDLKNPSFDKMFGCEHDDYFDEPLNVLFEDSQADLNTQILKASTVQRGLTVDVEAQRKDGSVFPAELTIGFIKNDGYVCVIHDISERKRIEQSLRTAVEREQELNELKSRFVSMASHEFLTPLATIHATTETLSVYRQQLSDEQVEQKLTTVREQVGYLKEIMSDVLKLTRLQARRVAFNPATVDLDALCREVINEYSNQVGFIHEVQYTSSKNTPTAWLDRKLMRQLFSNLLSNALKYSPDDKTITVKLEHTENMLVFSVRDRGIGIPENDLQNLFEPFHRATNVGTIHGTGLGLVIAKESVDLHGGTISVESELGVGTTFTVHLPYQVQRAK